MNGLDWVLEILSKCVKDGYCGTITIHFYKGGATTVDKTETIKP